MKYLFKSNKADNTALVEATDEKEARHLAMVKLWGPPSGIYGTKYSGYGLYLVEAVT